MTGVMFDISDKIYKLTQHKKVLTEYLLSKYYAEDWHGVSDAANDIRDTIAEINAYQTIQQKVERVINGDTKKLGTRDNSSNTSSSLFSVQAGARPACGRAGKECGGRKEGGGK